VNQPGRAKRSGQVRQPITHRALLIAAGIVVIVLLAVFGLDRCSSSTGSSGSPPSAGATPKSGLPTIASSALPSQARAVLALIDKGGPFAYKQDNTVFGNNERLLPIRPSGYYREYTVATPGSKDRGERRLIAGREGDIYYTSDHYESFRQVIR
jgi:ribonuclease T1